MPTSIHADRPLSTSRWNAGRYEMPKMDTRSGSMDMSACMISCAKSCLSRARWCGSLRSMTFLQRIACQFSGYAAFDFPSSQPSMSSGLKMTYWS